jgi:hypothetical protein
MKNRCKKAEPSPLHRIKRRRADFATEKRDMGQWLALAIEDNNPIAKGKFNQLIVFTHSLLFQISGLLIV